MAALDTAALALATAALAPAIAAPAQAAEVLAEDEELPATAAPAKPAELEGAEMAAPDAAAPALATDAEAAMECDSEEEEECYMGETPGEEGGAEEPKAKGTGTAAATSKHPEVQQKPSRGKGKGRGKNSVKIQCKGCWQLFGPEQMPVGYAQRVQGPTAAVFLERAPLQRPQAYDHAQKQRPQHAFCNLTQRAEHASAPMVDTSVFPALIRNSMMVDIGQSNPPPRRLVHPAEHCRLQGFPALLGAPEDPSNAASLPFPKSLLLVGCPGALTGQELRSLAGNGMHAAALGTWAAVRPSRRSHPVRGPRRRQSLRQACGHCGEACRACAMSWKGRSDRGRACVEM